MYNILKPILIVLFISVIQLLLYAVYLKPIITTWGASKKEISMPLTGDDKNLEITSTRAISINATKSDVWKWLMQLGADRAGFYSYEFIEKPLGYVNQNEDLREPQFKDLQVGDMVRGSIQEEQSIIPYNFKVLSIKPEETLVLENWGTFLLESINSQQTRLVVRTQTTRSKNLQEKFAHYIAIPFHFIMERRTLIGIKARAEAGENIRLSQTSDIIWFLGMVLSALSIFILIVIRRGILSSFFIPTILSVCWLFTLLLLPPVPLCSIGLLLVVCICYRITSKKCGGASGRIILEPYAEIPVREKWLFDNKTALKKVTKGLEDSRKGHVVKPGNSG
ncbi:MAG: hypothetical protein K0R48_902 [Gammaproteobacteria bacterium]|jgi:hypothetical protein|nr:hypothetical protein [Gammaproteobacteria bacterium]